jgi:lipopolysaccharide transport system permease protein
MRQFSASPHEIAASFWRNRSLILQLTKREVIGRYRGSVLGILWSFFYPLLMLAVYTLVFGVVFKARWIEIGDSKVEFALVLFAGLLVFNLFAECIGRAPYLILANANYVKKVVFPLEILPWVAFASALFHSAISFAVWILVYSMAFGIPHITVLLFPIVLANVMLMTMGLSWLLASLGVYLRDVGQLVGIVVPALLFLSPIFYPLAALPEDYRPLFYANPLTLVIENARDVLVWGKIPDCLSFALFTVLAACAASLGFAWFQKTRRGFADVL